MRDPNRLDNVYAEVARLHKENLPDWRIGQLWLNFGGWMWQEKQKDMFFSEEEEFLKCFTEFIEEMTS